MDHNEYSKIEAVNWSSLKLLEESSGGSPLLYKWSQEHSRPDTPAYVLGRAIHCTILEPDEFASRYVVYEDGTRRGKAWDAFQAAHAGVDILKPAEMDTVSEAAHAVRSRPDIMALLAQGRPEQTITWTDPGTGLACKGRADLLSPSWLLDLKTTSASLVKWPYDASKYLYHGQFAFYESGAVAAGNLPPDHAPTLALVVQTVEPFDVGLFRLPADTIEAGRRLYRRLLDRLKICMDTDFWPGAMPDPQDLVLSRWAAGNEEIEIDTEEAF